jgi:hypothetical protein
MFRAGSGKHHSENADAMFADGRRKPPRFGVSRITGYL